ncbi:MAG: tail fiber domain-containing protein [Rhizobacter sp.]|nr:tail fiber domain-containing protein [Ferruginibacter sp.]
MKIFCLLFLLFVLSSNTHAQNIGIGTSTPKAAFHIAADKTVLFGNDSTTEDYKFIYYGVKGALRSGFVGSYYDVGEYSAAFGLGNGASGIASFSSGSGNIASGHLAHALGSANIASGYLSAAIGYQNTSSRLNAVAIGSGNSSSGTQSISIGSNLTASGPFSTAMGNHVSTNEYGGCFIIGDADPYANGATLCGIANQFVARFANGYYLITSGDNLRTGVQIGAGGNAWLSISDKNRKENFESLNDEDILKKLSAITYSSWNYKGQDAKTFRHYGIMAQDFYAAFGKDSFGTIGCDTLVNPVDMQGIAFSAIKALEVRTQEIGELKAQLVELQRVVALLQKYVTPGK